MTGIHNKIEHNLLSIQRRIAEAASRAGRLAQDVRLIAVTKTVGPQEINVLRQLGVTDIGENRIEGAKPKIESLGHAVCWHMVGTVQRRKARDVVTLFDVVDSVDRVEVAEALQKRCEELDKHMPVLLEVNVSGEMQKHGFTPGTLDAALRDIRAFDRLTVNGLMTMAPLSAPESVLRSLFAGLLNLAQVHGLKELSMGMTDDFEIAIEEGATQVRIGRALFE